MKEYRCSSSFYNVHITVSNAFLGLVCLVALVIAGAYPTFRAIIIAVAVVAFYSFWNAFIAKANPSKVCIGPEGVAFSSFGAEHRYLRSELTGFRVRELGGLNKMFIRVNKPGLLRGRYWVDVFYFNDAQELAQEFLKLEQEMHPDSLKAVARSGKPLNQKK